MNRRMIQSCSAFFDEAWPQPFDNSQRMWSYDRTVTIEKPLVTAPWRSFGFYALTGKSTISFGKRITKETVCEALEGIRKQNPVGRILLVADNYGSHHANLTQERVDELDIEFVLHSAVLASAERDRTAVEESQTRDLARDLRE